MSRVLLVVAVALVAVSASWAAAPPAKVGIRATSLGLVLVDAQGRTLYAFDLDKAGRSACSGACAAAWPPLVTSGKPHAAGIPASKLRTVKRSDGRLQVTFAGHPLYFFAKDRKAGQVAGAAVAHWAALSPGGVRVHATSAGGAVPPPVTSTNPGYGGGDGY